MCVTVPLNLIKHDVNQDVLPPKAPKPKASLPNIRLLGELAMLEPFTLPLPELDGSDFLKDKDVTELALSDAESGANLLGAEAVQKAFLEVKVFKT